MPIAGAIYECAPAPYIYIYILTISLEILSYRDLYRRYGDDVILTKRVCTCEGGTRPLCFARGDFAVRILD